MLLLLLQIVLVMMLSHRCFALDDADNGDGDANIEP